MARQKGSLESAPHTSHTYEGEEIVSAMVVDEGELEAKYKRKIMGNVVAAEALSEEELKSSAQRKILCHCLVPHCSWCCHTPNWS
jgi:hypothetical protein